MEEDEGAGYPEFQQVQAGMEGRLGGQGLHPEQEHGRSGECGNERKRAGPRSGGLARGFVRAADIIRQAGQDERTAAAADRKMSAGDLVRSPKLKNPAIVGEKRARSWTFGRRLQGNARARRPATRPMTARPGIRRRSRRTPGRPARIPTSATSAAAINA